MTRESGPAITVDTPATGREWPEPAEDLSWSPDGRYVTWASGSPQAIAVVDTVSRDVRSFACPCSSGVFSGDRLLAFENDLAALLVLSPGGASFQRVRLRGAITRLDVTSIHPLGADASGILVMFETGSKQYSFFRVDLTGRAKRVGGGIPAWWPGHPVSDGRRGVAAFGIASNGGPCGSPDGIVVTTVSPPSVRQLTFPHAPTRWNVVDAEWGADGHLYVATANWPYCEDSSREMSEPGEVWERDGDRWQDTGLKLLGYLPISAHSYVGLRGTVSFDREGTPTVDHDLIIGAAGGLAPRVVATGVGSFAVNPRSMVPFTGAEPAPPSPSPSPRTLVLGRSWATNQEGYGTARPSKIYNGGDPTGLVQSVRWTSWGGATATATGMGLWAPGIVADGTMEPVKVVAFDRGDCRGTYAYRSIEWYFPQHGQAFRPHGPHQDICTGS